MWYNILDAINRIVAEEYASLWATHGIQNVSWEYNGNISKTRSFQQFYEHFAVEDRTGAGIRR